MERVMMTSSTSLEESDILDGLGIIDCDSHLTEPPDLWTSRVASSMRDQVPVQRTVDGRTGWYLDGSLWASTGGNVIAKGGRKILGAVALQPFEELDPAVWQVAERLK